MDEVDSKTRIKLVGHDYEVIDEVAGVRIADSFVKKNKLISTGGHGEARLYVCPKTKGLDFFDDFGVDCFFVRKDFVSYLINAKPEYENQEQEYRDNIAKNWQSYLDQVRQIDELVSFRIKNATPKRDIARFYVRSDDSIWDIFRSIALPQISYVSILKLERNDKRYYYFRLFLDYFYDQNNHPTVIKKIEQELEKQEIANQIKQTEKEQITKARIGQGDFRNKLLSQQSSCPVTGVNDERLLVASHIKPWAKSDNKERLDPANGILLTPTYDKLFNDGYISFLNDGIILISPYISPLNIKRLNLAPGRKYSLPKGRKDYLNYHRKNIFKTGLG